MGIEFAAEARPLAADELDRIAASLQIDLPELWAVMTVETRGCGFLPDRRPVILFERHIFHRRTGGRFSASAPDISNPSPGGYGAGGDWQYQRLAQAMRLDRTAALESASWGLGQVMGFNATLVGFADVEDMVAQMCTCEDAQLRGVAGFIDATGLAPALRGRDWTRFAYLYNGQDFQKFQYDKKLALAYARYHAGPLPNLTVREAQLLLTYLGYRSVGTVDGWYGANTQRALLAFQSDQGLAATGAIDEDTMQALRGQGTSARSRARAMAPAKAKAKARSAPAKTTAKTAAKTVAKTVAKKATKKTATRAAVPGKAAVKKTPTPKPVKAAAKKGAGTKPAAARKAVAGAPAAKKTATRRGTPTKAGARR